MKINLYINSHLILLKGISLDIKDYKYDELEINIEGVGNIVTIVGEKVNNVSTILTLPFL